MAYVHREGKCSGCRHLYSLGVECVIITLTVLHVLMSTSEILIHLEVIQVPSSTTNDVVTTAPTTVAAGVTTVVASSTYDPGGAVCDPDNIHKYLLLTVQVFRYTTMIVSGLFLIEIFCKAIYLKKAFFKDGWQVFDTMVVLVSLGVEVVYFVFHTTLYCYHPTTELAGYIIVLRLWRIPRACNVRKKQYRNKLEDEIRYLTQTKMETDLRHRRLEDIYLKQEQENTKLRTLLVGYGHHIQSEDKVPNGSGPPTGAMTETIKRVFSAADKDGSATINHELEGSVPSSNGIIIGSNTVQYTKQNSSSPLVDNDALDSEANSNSEPNNKLHTDLERNDSDVNSRANDSGIEVKDSFRSDKAASVKVSPDDDDVFDENDGSEVIGRVKGTNVKEVEVQIEETSRQNQLPSIRSMEDDSETTKVVMRRKMSDRLKVGAVNAGYEGDAEDLDGTSTYRSADGIPMTDL